MAFIPRKWVNTFIGPAIRNTMYLVLYSDEEAKCLVNEKKTNVVYLELEPRSYFPRKCFLEVSCGNALHLRSPIILVFNKVQFGVI